LWAQYYTKELFVVVVVLVFSLNEREELTYLLFVVGMTKQADDFFGNPDCSTLIDFVPAGYLASNY
jgi:hypothetical protein